MLVASFRESSDPSLDDSEDDADAEEDEGGERGRVEEGREREEAADEAEDECYSTASEVSAVGGRDGGRRQLSLGDRTDAAAATQAPRQRLRLSSTAESGAHEARRASQRALHRLYRRVTLRAVLIDLGFAAVAPLPCLLGVAGGSSLVRPEGTAGEPSAALGEASLAWHTTLFGTRYAAAPEVWRAADAASAASVAARASAGSSGSSAGVGHVPPSIPGVGYTRAVDSWGLGVISFYVLTGTPPFEEGAAGAAELKADILSGAFPKGGGVLAAPRLQRVGGSSSASALRPVPWGVLHPGARALVEGLLAVEPAKRWTPAQALAHPWTLQLQPLPPPLVVAGSRG